MKLIIEKDKEGKVSIINEGFDAIEVLGLISYLHLMTNRQLIKHVEIEDKINESSKKKNP